MLAYLSLIFSKFYTGPVVPDIHGTGVPPLQDGCAGGRTEKGKNIVQTSYINK